LIKLAEKINALNFFRMNFNKLEYYFSQPRLNRFLAASGNSKAKVQNLYHANLKVTQSFYPVLNIFEVFSEICAIIRFQLDLQSRIGLLRSKYIDRLKYTSD